MPTGSRTSPGEPFQGNLPFVEIADDPSAPTKPRATVLPIVLAALLGLFAGDALKAPADQIGVRLAVGVIDTYRSTLSRVFERSGLIRCRFQPTCSTYGREAILRYGLPGGAALAAWRVLRCNPFSAGGVDPVP
jgi:putative membrane protein insertion efficiency factor